ncbi:hypothetical protein K469DRAFT_712356 [Zopfia rhizophila CBS 207.26]|uniref:Mid2 domain-containing protein n=1 Tax=Zopfia rhizophila CBS 207.26 TaxID=1314779 RepID=A0A6A6EU14_9PEZI|nr:hypothetical protein K469DRAFT_712356 [Zopfia rhizophila CBS 207.26]
MSQCYGTIQGKIKLLSTRKPCGPTNATVPVVPCCNADDTCLAHGICHYDTRSIEGGSGYYVAACTDPNYKDKNCRQLCTSQARTDISYNSNLSRWQCCGADSDKNANCDNATNDGFDVPAPTLLQTYWPTIRATSIPTPNPTSSPQQSSPPGLSTSAAGGIGAGVAVGVLALVGLGIFFLLRRRRQHDRERQLGNTTFPHQSSVNPQYASVSQDYKGDVSSQYGANAYDAPQPRHELSQMTSPVEVAGNSAHSPPPAVLLGSGSHPGSPQELPAGEAPRATSSSPRSPPAETR